MYNKNRKKIERWDEAIPLGNGNLGGLLYGDDQKVLLSIDCSSLWDLRQEERLSRSDYTFDQFLFLVRGGAEKNKELQSRFGRFFEEAPYPTRIPTGSFSFSLSNGADTNFRFDKKNACAEVQISPSEKIETFFSADNGFGYVRCTENVKVVFVPPDYQKAIEKDKEIVGGSLGWLCYPRGELIERDGISIYRQPTATGSYSVIVKIKKKDGVQEIVFAVKAENSEHTEEEYLTWLNMAVEKGFDFEFALHKKWWNAYFSKVKISLPEEEKDLQELYELTHYLLGAGSRKGSPPMSLQGVWTAADGTLPPWKGDFHFDLNIQGTYNWVYRTGRWEELHPLIEYFLKNREEIEKFTERFFGVEEGFFIPGTADLKGHIMGGWVQYTYSIGSSFWMLLMLDKWYEYTQDKDYLTEFLLPVEKKAFRLLKERFLEEKNGEYHLILSSSPEINNAEYSAWVTNSTYDLSLIRCFLQTYAIRLQENGETFDEALSVERKLVKEQVGKDGYLLAENMPLNETHRHLSHCMNIYPLQQLDILQESDKTVIQKTIERVDKLGTDMWIGFSFVWMAALYAMAMDGENALKYLRIFTDGFVSPNGFHLNGDYKRKGYSSFDYRPFTLEANGMYADALQEMLLQYHHDILRLFPAVPEEWIKQGCSFNDFYLCKDIKVDAEVKEGKIVCEIENFGETKNLDIYVFKRLETIQLKKGKNKFRW